MTTNNTTTTTTPQETLDEVKNDMLGKLKELFDQEQEDALTVEEEIDQNTGRPLEEAVDKALEALGEIVIYAECNRPWSCAEVANTAISVIKALKEKHDEEVKIMDALSSPLELELKLKGDTL